MTGPLTGLRVIDCSTGTAGTRVGAGFADYGADVVWVEPVGGDRLRDELKIEYSVYNRGKRGVGCDLSTPHGLGGLRTLLRSADVLIHSWRPGVAERLGIGFEAVHAEFPHLVVADVSAFGQDGPHRDVPGYESLVFALAGVTAEQVSLREPPIYVGLPFASLGAAYLAQIGILAALHRRHSDGHGRLVETSLVDGVLAYLGMVWGDSDDLSVMPQLNPGGRRLVSRTFLCADGKYVGVHTGAVGAFGRFITVMGLQDEIPVHQDGSDMGVALDAEQAAIVRDRIPELFLGRSREEWLKILVEADVCAIPVLHAGEAFDEPQARHNGMVVEVDDPELGPIEQVAPPAKFANHPTSTLRSSPRIGEHSLEVFEQAAGLPARPAPSGAPDRRPLLDGLRVLDLGAYYAGPYASRLLADLGADVLKVESIAGDQLRGLARCFRSAQAGKRAIAVNLKDDALRPALDALIAHADVITHNMRPGAAERLGVGYADVKALNPEAIYLDSPPWGTSGPRVAMQSFAPLVSGIVGASYEVAGQFNEPLFPVGNEDPGAGLLGATAILIGLYARDHSGSGCYVESNQFNATFAHVAHIVRRADGEVLGAERLDPLQMGVSATDRIYEATDGYLAFAVAGPAAPTALSALLGRDITAEPKYATPQARRDNDYELTAELSSIFCDHDFAWAKSTLGDVRAGVVRPIAQNNCMAYHRDPENLRSGRIAQVVDPEFGVIREIARLVRVSDADVAPHKLAPRHGEHTESVLTEIGYSAHELDRLRERAAIR